MKTQGYQEKECDEDMIRAAVELLIRGFVLFKWYTLNGVVSSLLCEFVER